MKKVNVLDLGAEPSSVELYRILPRESKRRKTVTVPEGVNSLVECIPKRHYDM